MRQPRAALRAAEKKVAESSKLARELAPVPAAAQHLTFPERLRKAADLLDAGDVDGAALLVQSVGTHIFTVLWERRGDREPLE